MGIIALSHAEQGLERIVAWNDEAGDIGQELTTDVEEDEEEVGCDKAEEGISLGDRGLLLQVVQDRVLGELHSTESANNSQDAKDAAHAHAELALAACACAGWG